ncbi:MAG TPA: T9SS type A sorting domain-containing protein, partial [Ignavibacteria bacterium]|nr:T9SS type A sorting domain-containing protein [Ignavibacteria bacterium]
SDDGVVGDGWYVDDVKLTNYCAGTPVGIGQNTGIPLQYGLDQNYPNPFNPSTYIKFQLPEGGNVKITVFDILGKEVASLINEKMEAGYHNVEFNASDLASGLYIYKMESGNFTDVKKMMLIK